MTHIFAEGRDPGRGDGLHDRVLGGRQLADVVQPRVPAGRDLGGVEVVLQRGEGVNQSAQERTFVRYGS